MARNEPPDVFQANIGRDVMQWVLVNGFDARESKILPLDKLVPDSVAWRRNLRPAMVNALSHDGKMYAASSNVHRVNSVFCNKRLFDRYHLPLPTKIADLYSIGQKLKGTGITPLALGSRDPWPIALLVFESLLVAKAGPEFYERFFAGNLTPEHPMIKATLAEAIHLLDLVNTDHGSLSWAQATELVAQDRAAMTVMGDWAVATFVVRKMRQGQDFVELPFPESEGTFVYTSDTFALPKEGKNIAGGARLLQTIGSPEAQRTFCDVWGALPARLDVVLAEGSPLRAKQESLKNGTLVLALSGLLPARFSDDLSQSLAEMAKRRDIEPVLNTLRSRYALLK